MAMRATLAGLGEHPCKRQRVEGKEGIASPHAEAEAKETDEGVEDSSQVHSVDRHEVVVDADISNPFPAHHYMLSDATMREAGYPLVDQDGKAPEGFLVVPQNAEVSFDELACARLVAVDCEMVSTKLTSLGQHTSSSPCI